MRVSGRLTMENLTPISLDSWLDFLAGPVGVCCSKGGPPMARSPRPEPQKENPDSVAAEIGVQGIEALPKRVDRYGKAKEALSTQRSIWRPCPSIKLLRTG